MEMTQKKITQKTTLEIHGKLGIQESIGLQPMLLEALRQAEHLELQLEDVNQIGISGMQLLCSAKQQARRESKLLTLHFSQAGDSSNMCLSAGCRDAKECESFDQGAVRTQGVLS